MTCEILVEYATSNPVDGYYLSLRSEKFHFFIGEPYCYSDEDIDALIGRREGFEICGGGNSCWSLCFNDGSFHIEYIISGLGLDSSFSYSFNDDKPILELLELMKKINKLNQENRRYVSSEDHIKVS